MRVSRFFLAVTVLAVLGFGATPTQEANAEGDWRIRDDGLLGTASSAAVRMVPRCFRGARVRSSRLSSSKADPERRLATHDEEGQEMTCCGDGPLGFPKGLLAALCLLSSAVASCNSVDVTEFDLPAWVEGSPELARLVKAHDTVVVLLYSPEACFSCGGGMARWGKLKKEGRQIHLGLTRQPTSVEDRRLKLAKVQFDFVLSNRSLPEAMDLLFIAGSLVRADTLAGARPRSILELLDTTEEYGESR